MNPEETMIPSDTVLSLHQNTETLVTIKPNGMIEYGPKYSPDAAAKALWEAISHEAQLMLQLAKREENEACARIAEDYLDDHGERMCGEAVGEVIRSRVKE